MAKADKETIKNLAELSRIGCPDEEQEALLKDLNGILAYVDQLKEIDTEDVPPCNHVIEGMVNVTRADKTEPPLPRKVFLDNAPDQIGGLIRVPAVIKKK